MVPHAGVSSPEERARAEGATLSQPLVLVTLTCRSSGGGSGRWRPKGRRHGDADAEATEGATERGVVSWDLALGMVVSLLTKWLLAVG